MITQRKPAGRVVVSGALVFALVLAGCTREQRTINTYGELRVSRGSEPAVVTYVEGRLDDTMLRAADFDAAWAVVTRRAAPYDGLALTLHGGSDANPQGATILVGFVLVLPTPLNAGASFPIGLVLPAPPAGMPMYWHDWGGRDLASADAAEIALRVFDYYAVGMRVERNFVATEATGTVEITGRGRDWVDLRLDITATDAAGETLRIEGGLSIRVERYTPPFS